VAPLDSMSMAVTRDTRRNTPVDECVRSGTRVSALTRGCALDRMVNERPHLLVLHEKPIMAVGGSKDVKFIRTGGEFYQFRLQPQWEQSVTVDSHHREWCVNGRQGARNSPSASTDIEQTHRLGQRNIGVCVETSGEFIRVMIKVGLDGEPAP